MVRICRGKKRSRHLVIPNLCTLNGEPPPVLLPPFGTGSSIIPNGMSSNTWSTSLAASAASRISSSVGRRYSLPPGPSTTTAVTIAPRRPAAPSKRRSSRFIAGKRQHTQVAPERDMVPAPILLSYSRRCAPLPPWVEASSPLKMLKTGPVLSALGSTLSKMRLLSFLQSHFVLSRGIVARQFLHLTVRAQR